MDTVQDFEDILSIMHKHEVKYLIIGGLAFIYHAKPRYTKAIDIWGESTAANIERANAALQEFGSPYIPEFGKENEVVQIGVPPNRIDLLQNIEGVVFADAWAKREQGPYGKVTANWIDIDSLISAKGSIDVPRHQQDVKELLKVKEMKREKKG